LSLGSSPLGSLRRSVAEELVRLVESAIRRAIANPDRVIAIVPGEEEAKLVAEPPDEVREVRGRLRPAHRNASRKRSAIISTIS
jgi:hypothetical protein